MTKYFLLEKIYSLIFFFLCFWCRLVSYIIIRKFIEMNQLQQLTQRLRNWKIVIELQFFVLVMAWCDCIFWQLLLIMGLIDCVLSFDAWILLPSIRKTYQIFQSKTHVIIGLEHYMKKIVHVFRENSLIWFYLESDVRYSRFFPERGCSMGIW